MKCYPAQCTLYSTVVVRLLYNVVWKSMHIYFTKPIEGFFNNKYKNVQIEFCFANIYLPFHAILQYNVMNETIPRMLRLSFANPIAK